MRRGQKNEEVKDGEWEEVIEVMEVGVLVWHLMNCEDQEEIEDEMEGEEERLGVYPDRDVWREIVRRETLGRAKRVVSAWSGLGVGEEVWEEKGTWGEVGAGEGDWEAEMNEKAGYGKLLGSEEEIREVDESEKGWEDVFGEPLD